MIGVVEKFRDCGEDLERRIRKLQYTKLVYDKIQEVAEDESLKGLAGALARGIEISLDILGAGDGEVKADEQKLDIDVQAVMEKLSLE